MKALGIVLAVAAILSATLYPSGGAPPPGWSLAFASSEALDEIVQNLLLFVPFGAALTLAGVRPWPTVALGALLSLSVEFAQQWIPGRDPSGGDIMCNTLSTAIGVTLVRTADAWLFVPPRRAAWQALGAAILAAAVWLATAALIPWGPFAGRTIGDGWRVVFFPETLPDGMLALLNAVWLGAWTSLVGYWAARSPGAGRNPAAIAAVLLSLGTVLGAPAVLGMRTTPSWELAGALVGLIGGWAMRVIARPRSDAMSRPAA